MRKVYFILLFMTLFTACSQESTPYEEINQTLPDSSKQGYIETH